MSGFVLVVITTAAGVYQLLPDQTEAAGLTVATEQVVPPPSAVGVANEFLDALTSGDPAAAAELTDDPAATTAVLSDVWLGLKPAGVTASRTELVEPQGRATSVNERFTLTWDLGQGRAWEYESTMRLVRHENRWLVRWQPAIVHPRLPAGHGLTLRDLTGQPAVLDRDRAPLLTWSDRGPVAAEPPVAPLLTPAMGQVVSGRGAGADGWHVALVNKAGKETGILHGSRAKPLVSTLSRRVQQAAQSAVDGQRRATVLVAVQPSTGDLLAVAQNASAGEQPIALNGLYPPGSTFKIATAAAVIGAGGADVDTVLPCPGSTRIGQRTIGNADFALGEVPLRTAFAESCNTTFAELGADLPADALPGAANRLGLGANFDIPGITTELGAVRAASNTAQQVENSIGQGTVRASCLGLAVMTATVAGGRAVTPKLWRGLDTRVLAGYEAPPGHVLDSLRTMMRAVVTDGTGSALAGYGEVYGKTGTAQVDGSAHGWFVGYRGDLAFATLVLDGLTSATAVEVTGAFLGAVGR